MSRVNGSSRSVVIRPPKLAKPGDPLVLPDGTLIEEAVDAPPIDAGELRTNIAPNARTFRAVSKRVLKELSSNSTTTNAISVVFAYTMLGISDVEITEVLHIDPSTLKQIREHKAYVELFDAVFSEFVNTNSELLQSRIAAYAHNAVERVGYLATKAKKEETQLSASKDILDRAGARPVDLQKQNNMQMNELRIVILDESKEVQVDVRMGEISIDLQPN